MGNPVEDNFVTRFILGFAVVFAMLLGGGGGAWVLTSIGIPYGDWLGVAVGAVIVFLVFVVLYRRYDASAELG